MTKTEKKEKKVWTDEALIDFANESLAGDATVEEAKSFIRQAERDGRNRKNLKNEQQKSKREEQERKRMKQKMKKHFPLFPIVTFLLLGAVGFLAFRAASPSFTEMKLILGGVCALPAVLAIGLIVRGTETAMPLLIPCVKRILLGVIVLAVGILVLCIKEMGISFATLRFYRDIVLNVKDAIPFIK